MWAALVCSPQSAAARPKSVTLSRLPTDDFAPPPPFEFLLDPTAKLDLEDLRAAEDTRFSTKEGRVANFGRCSSALWARLELVNDSETNQLRLLDVEWPRLDQVDLYVIRSSTVSAFHSGWRVPFSQRAIPQPTHMFPLEFAPGERIQLYLRVQSFTELIFISHIRTPVGQAQMLRKRGASEGFFYGLIIALGLFNLLVYLRLRRPYYLHFIAGVFCFAGSWLMESGWYGLLEFLIPYQRKPIWILFGFWAFFRLAFARGFLETPTVAVKLDKYLKVAQNYLLPALIISALILPFPTFIEAALGYVQLAILAATVWAGILAARHRVPMARAFTWASGIGTLGMAMGTVIFSGLKLHPGFAGAPIMIGSIAEIFVISYALIESERQARTLKEQALHRAEAERLFSLQNLVAGVTHELNTPLGSLLSSVDSLGKAGQRLQDELQDQELKPKAKRALKAIPQLGLSARQAVERIDEVVRSLKGFARLDESAEKEVRLQEGIDAALLLLKPNMKPGISVERNYSHLPLVRCRAQEINQVFMSVLKNALQAISPEEGWVRIVVRRELEFAVVEVTDNGVGIPPEKLLRIFEPQLHSQGQRVRMGLGLSTSQRVIDAHGGTIEVNSKLGEGTRVCIRIPIFSRPEEELPTV